MRAKRSPRQRAHIGDKRIIAEARSALGDKNARGAGAARFRRPIPERLFARVRRTQQDIADLVHANRPVVTRIMNDLRRPALRKVLRRDKIAAVSKRGMS